MRRALREKGFDASSVNAFMGSIIDTPAKFWEKYRHVGESIENANREPVEDNSRLTALRDALTEVIAPAPVAAK